MTSIDHLRAEIVRAALQLAHHPSGALIAQTAAQCDELAGLVSNHDPPHEWFALGMNYVFCRICGIQRTEGEKTVVDKTLELTYDTDAKRIQVAITVDTAETSVSQLYCTAHLPTSANQAKSSWSAKGPGDVTLETIYSEAAGAGSIVLNVTAGSSADAVAVTVTTGGVAQQVTGTTGTPLTVTL